MKKALSILIVLCSLLTVFCITAIAADSDLPGRAAVLSLTMQIDNPVMTVNDTQKEIDPGRGTVPVIVNNRTLVPVRAIVEEMGGSVAWEENTQTATLTYEENEIKLTIDDITAIFNDEVYNLDVAPTTINDRTMLPIRFIAERFRFEVDWFPEEQIIAITKNTSGSVSSSDPAVTPQPEISGEASQSQALVVYFSATGNTRTLAENIAEAAGADLVEIVPETLYTSEDLNYNNDSSRANQEMNSDARPAIQPLAVDLSEYDVILLGYPIWWGQCPAPVLTFLESNDLSGKTIMPFCTSGSSGISGSLSKIRQLSPGSTVTEGFRGTSSTTVEQIRTWLESSGLSDAA